MHLTVTGVHWERVNVTVNLELLGYDGTGDDLEFIFVDGRRRLPLESEALGSGQYRVTFNITNFQGRQPVPNGTWRVVAHVRQPDEPALAELGQQFDLDDTGVIAAIEDAGGELTASEEDAIIEGAGPEPMLAQPRCPGCGLSTGAHPGHGYSAAQLENIDWEMLEGWSKTFLYARNTRAYVVEFGVANSEVSPDVLVRTYELARQAAQASPTTLRGKARAVRNRVRRRVRRVVRYAMSDDMARLIYRWYRFTARGTDKRVLFASQRRAALGGNLLAVRDRMVERGLDREYELGVTTAVHTTRNPLFTFGLIKAMARADTILVDDYFPMLAKLPLPEETTTIQVWHAGVGFKSIGFSRFGRYGSPTLKNVHRYYTYAICGSESLRHVYGEAFGIEDDAVIPTGLPRIDTFLDEEHIAQVKADWVAQYPHLQGKRIILFAPTFRGGGAGDAFYDYGRIDFERLHEACGDDSVVLFRMHHFVPDAPPIPAHLTDRLIDFHDYPDTNDLLHLTDVLVTDYSSIIYEYALLDRPMVFYAYDKVLYGAIRGFHKDYDEAAPGTVCETFDELVDVLVNERFDLSKVEAFRKENFDHVDRHSSDRVIDWLILGNGMPTDQEKVAS